MSGPTPPAATWDPEAVLRHVGLAEDAAIDLAEAALALAAMERRHLGPTLYRNHLDAIAAEMAMGCKRIEIGASGDEGLQARAAVLAEVMSGSFGYQGDRVTYDDMQNANLMRVIDRRKGLPVALSILYIHAARSQNWQVEGVNFPGHFVIRLFHDGKAAILDPFEGGQICSIADLRRKLKATVGDKAELTPEHYAPIGNRDILLRLENNIKTRLIQESELQHAVMVVDRMLMVAPKHAPLWRESGLIHAKLGNLMAARAALLHFLEISDNEAQRHHAARLLQEIGQQLH